jgi:hypothetical protein
MNTTKEREFQHQKVFRNFLKMDSISRHLYCTICQEVFDEPKRLVCGYVIYNDFSHTYCHDCIDQWRKKVNTCPVCRSKFSEVTTSKDLIAMSLVNDLEVLCNNKSKNIFNL